MRRLLLALVLFAAVASAALPTTAVFETEELGSNLNGGCFIEGATGTDYSQQAAAQYTFTNLVIDASTNTIVTSASHNFVSTDVGNCLRINSGSGFTTGVFQIVSVASNAATLDRAAGTTSSTGGTFHVGGALATLAQLNTDMCSGCRAWVKADAPYVISSKVTWNYTSSGASWIKGYTTSRGDGGRAEIKSTGSIGGDRLIDINMAGNFTFANFTINVNSDTGVSCMYFLNQPEYAENIDCKNFNASGAQIQFNNIRGICRNCSIHDGTSGGGSGFLFTNFQNACYYCSVVNVTGTFEAFHLYENFCQYCAVINVGTAASASDGFAFPGGNGYTAIDHAVCYNVARDCVRIANIQQPMVITNSILVGSVNGINNVSGTTLRDGDILNDYNFTYNMSGAAVVNLTAGPHSVALSGTPFTNASSLDFTLNATAGAGGAVRAAGVPFTFMGLMGTGYPDGGLFQHQDSGGGGGAAAGSFVVAN